MVWKVGLVGIGILLGVFLGYVLFNNSATFTQKLQIPLVQPEKKQVIGFLLYSLLPRAQTDYSSYITTLSYFGLTVASDGTIQKFSAPGEANPGYHALYSGQVDPFLRSAKQHNITRSLVVFSGSSPSIDDLVSSPSAHAKNLANEINPIMSKYGFTDLNLDIEHVAPASHSAQLAFLQFVKTFKNALPEKTTITIDISTEDLINSHDLIIPKEVGKLADYIVVMAYDYHSSVSFVSGPVAPLAGAGVESEYDVKTAMQLAMGSIPKQKLLMGMPLYGYEWETLSTNPRSAIVPGSGVAASNRRAQNLEASCASCSAVFDTTEQEEKVTYFDTDTKTYHQIFYPTSKSTQAKIDFANDNGLAGVALWSLGYEGKDILDPLKNY